MLQESFRLVSRACWWQKNMTSRSRVQALFLPKIFGFFLSFLINFPWFSTIVDRKIIANSSKSSNQNTNFNSHDFSYFLREFVCLGYPLINHCKISFLRLYSSNILTRKSITSFRLVDTRGGQLENELKYN